MSKAQLSGAVGYTGFIRPSLQCTQQCSLKPGRHAQEAGSYWPKPLDLGAKTTNLRAGPETSNTAMSAQMSPETYNNHCRQDRAEHNLAARTTPVASHWKSIGAEAFRLHTPPNGQKPRLYIQTAPVLPRAENHNANRPVQITSTSQLFSHGNDTHMSPSSGSPRRRKNKMR